MNGGTKNWSFGAWLRDRAYDAVFHVGDTALQFTADLIRGSENIRHDHYAGRQLRKQERKTAPAIKQPKPEKPLSYDERKVFTLMMRRQAGESVTNHWKRRKEMLRHPHKRQLIAVEQKVAASDRERSITVERKTIASEYQRSRVRPKTRSRKRKR